jgi:flagellar biosynthesis protein FlhG
MSDSTTEFHRFAARDHCAAAGRGGGPQVVVVSGGRPGVGATTLAVHLACTLARDAHRVILIDADLYRADIAAQCGLQRSVGMSEVLAGRKTIHETLQRGPAGMQILTGAASAEIVNGIGERAIQRLLKQMRTLAPHADWLLVDAGNQPSLLAARLWSAAASVLVVTAPDAVAVMDTYALMKTLLAPSAPPRRLSLVVNQAADESTAADVHRRIDQSCRRFLKLSVEFAGSLPNHAPADLALRGNAAGAHMEAIDPLSEAILRLAKQLFDATGRRQRLAA